MQSNSSRTQLNAVRANFVITLLPTLSCRRPHSHKFTCLHFLDLLGTSFHILLSLSCSFDQSCYSRNHTCKMSSLENLPPELRTKTLQNMQELTTLQSLVRASPAYHAQYRANRDGSLRTCLGFQLVDAYATFISTERKLRRVRTSKKDSKEQKIEKARTITTFLVSYGLWRSCASPVPALETISSVDLRWLVRHHFSVVLPDSFKETGRAMWDVRRLEESDARNHIETTWWRETESLATINHLLSCRGAAMQF